MAHNGGPRVPPRPPMPPPPRNPTTSGSYPATRRAPAVMSAPISPLTAPLTPLGTRRPPVIPGTAVPSPLGIVRHPTTIVAGPSSTLRSQTLANAPVSPVSLTAPRPDGERTVNEYVETPFRPNERTATPQTNTHSVSTNSGTTTVDKERSGRNHHHNHHQHPQQQQLQQPHRHHLVEVVRPDTLPLPVTKQPVAATFTKARPDPAAECAARGSIICPECGRCRCESCQQPRPLPQRWVCDKKCLCSVDAIIDYVSCLCCVKGFYYHCSKDYELDRDGDGVSCADDPCSCVPHRRVARWGCLAALTAVLPCLLCYWPLRGCARGLEVLYARHARTGCRCKPRHQQLTPEKRLLDSSPEF